MNFNKEIFELVPLVSESQRKTNTEKKDKDLVGIPSAIKLGVVKNLKRSKSDGYGNTLEAFKDNFGLKTDDYKKLSNIANQIIELEPYASYASVDFIEEHLFDWIITTYHDNKAKTEPLNYLLDVFEADLNEYNFYFEVRALGIESTFKIGNVEFMFFSDEIIKKHQIQFQKSCPEKKLVEFESIFKSFKSKPIAKITTKGIERKAKQNAQKQVNLVIDSLKCFLIEDSLSSHVKLMDADYRFKDILPNIYIYDTKSDKFDFNSSFERNGGVEPVSLDTIKIKQLLKSGLNDISEFIKKKTTSELAAIIHNTISKIGEYSSETNLHQRVIKIISLYEYLFIPKNKAKGLAQTIIKSRVLKKIIDDSQLEEIVKIFNKFFDVRNKYLHNGIEKHIDIDELYEVQKITLFLLKRLLVLNATLKSSEELLDYFDINKKAKV